MIIYGIKNCDTMKKAFDWLDAEQIPYSFHNYKTDGISGKKLEEWLESLPITEIVNTRSTTYKSLTAEEKIAISDNKKAIPLIIQNPSIIKRPLVEDKGQITLGFSEQKWKDTFC